MVSRGEAPKKKIDVARTFAIQIARNGLRSLVMTPNPLECMDSLKTKVHEIAQLLVPGREGMAAPTKNILLGGSITFGGTLLAWGGFALPAQAWVPILGFFIGGVGIMSLFQKIGRFQDSKKKMAFLKIYQACLLAMAKADDFFSDQERKQMATILEAFNLNEYEMAELMEMKLLPISAIQIPPWLDESHRKAILAGSFALIYCDGLTDQEVEAYQELARKCGILGVDLEDIKKTAMAAVDTQDRMYLTIGALADFMIPRNYLDKCFEGLLAVAPKKESLKKLKDAVRDAHEADREGQRETLKYEHVQTALMAAYFLCRVTVGPDVEALKKIEGRFDKLGNETGLLLTGKKFQESLEEYYKNLIEELTVWCKKVYGQVETYSKP